LYENSFQTGFRLCEKAEAEWCEDSVFCPASTKGGDQKFAILMSQLQRKPEKWEV
jgi:hypothetical protein